MYTCILLLALGSFSRTVFFNLRYRYINFEFWRPNWNYFSTSGWAIFIIVSKIFTHNYLIAGTFTRAKLYNNILWIMSSYSFTFVHKYVYCSKRKHSSIFFKIRFPTLCTYISCSIRFLNLSHPEALPSQVKQSGVRQSKIHNN